MNKKLLVISSIFLLYYSKGLAQTETNVKKNQFEFSTGYNFGALKNLEYSPVSRYDYQAAIYKLGYQRTTKKQNLFRVQLDYLDSELKTDIIPNLNLDYARIGLSFSYLKHIYSKDKFSFHLGLQSYTNVSLYSKFNQYRSIINQSLGITSQLSYKISSKHTLFSNLTIPVVSLRLTNSSGDTYSLNRNQNISWNLGYTYSLTNYLDLKFSYDFNYDRLQIPNAFREVQYQFNVGLNLKF